MDVIALLTGAAISLISLGIGHRSGRRHRDVEGLPPAICEGCKDSLSYHDENGRCHATDVHAGEYNSQGQLTSSRAFPCTCQQYVGPPADRTLENVKPSSSHKEE